MKGCTTASGCSVDAIHDDLYFFVKIGACEHCGIGSVPVVVPAIHRGQTVARRVHHAHPRSGEIVAYRARGGKVLVYDASADAASVLLPLGNNGAIRVVLTPGQPTCPDVDDGRAAGMVRALESWVERGKTSDRR